MLFAGAGPAGAHAALLGSDPKQGAVVATAPAQVSLTFSEQVSIDDDALRVLDPAGRRISTGKISYAGSDTYRIRLRTGLPHGTYTVSYQVISADSHPVSGAYTFSVGAPSVTKVSLPDGAAGGGVVGGLYDTARYVSYAGFILLVGGTVFVLACWPRGAGVRPVQRLVVAGWVAITAATLALLLMRGAYTGSGKLADIFDLGLLSGVLHTKPGTALISRLLLLAVAALFIAVLFGAYAKRDVDPAEADGSTAISPADPAPATRPDAAARSDLAFGLAVGGAVVAIGLATTWAMSEHASVGIQTRIAMPVDIVHLLAMATWLGGLAALLTSLYRVPSIEAAAVRRFSALAFGSVLALAATGIYQSWRQVGTWSALTGTGFGQLLLVKVSLVAVILLIAASSRRWTGRLADAPTSVTTLQRTNTDTDTGTPPDTATATTAPVPDTAAAVALDPSGPAVPSSATATAEPRPAPERTAQLARQQAAKDAVRRRRLREADPARSALRRSVLAEAAVAVAVLAVTTILTSTETGRTAQEAAHADGAVATAQQAPPVSLNLPFDTGGGAHSQGSVMLSLTPSHPGGNTVDIMVMDPNDNPLDIPEVTVRLTLASRHIGPLSITPRRTAVGAWSAKDVQIPMAGNWRFDVTVRTSDIDEVTVSKNAKIG